MRILLALLLCVTLALPAGAAGKNEPMVAPPPFLKIVASWSGEASAAELAALPQWRPRLRGGCLGDEAAFASFWQAVKPGTIPPGSTSAGTWWCSSRARPSTSSCPWSR